MMSPSPSPSDPPHSRHTEEEIVAIFKSCEALLHGHFVLRSGLHSREFFQCAKLLQHPRLAARLCEDLAGRVLEHFGGRESFCDSVISPAMGGILLGHEVGRQLGKRHIFAEKEDGRLVLRRGFTVGPNERFLIVEDVITRGGRVQETVDIVRNHGGEVVAIALLVDRSSGARPDFGCPVISLLDLNVETFPADDLPEDLLSTPAVKPGSK